jgi:hypothetical protein
MSRHPQEEELLRFRQGLAGPGEAVTRAHLASCRPCRVKLAEAEGFDEFVRQGLKRQVVPDHLLERIQRGLGRQKLRAGWGLTSPWRRMALGSAAAVLLAVLGLASLWAWSDLPRQGQGTGFDLQAAATQILRGQLVCFGCARHEADTADQQQCPGDGELHVTGLQTPDGNLWRFVESDAIHPFLADSMLRGQWVEVSAHPYPAIGYLQIAAARQL